MKMTEYYRSVLTAQEAAGYDALLSGIRAHRDPVVLMAGVNYGKIAWALELDHSELFAVDFRKGYTWGAGGYIFYHFPYLFSKEREDSIRIKIEKEAADLYLRGTESMPPEDAARCLHDRLGEKITYGWSYNTRNAYSIAGAFMDRRCVCHGYAKAYRYLCSLAGIRCLVVCGDLFSLDGKRTERHTWNMVELSGKWYQVDVTHDRARHAGDKSSGMYFGISQAQGGGIRKRRPDSIFPLPECTESLPQIRQRYW